jgi:putative endonuclease
MYTVYILESQSNGRRYIGQTNNVDDRLERHNRGRVRSTKPYRPWELIHVEEFETRSDAARREAEIKSYKGGLLLKKLIESD